MIRNAVRLLPVALLLITGAAHAQAPIKLNPPGQGGWQETAEATWYGGRHHGRRTSSGEVFDQNRMTAAHPYLPLGSTVRVTMESTGESVVVRVNDRQPSRRSVIDLSRGAAEQIGLVDAGRATVTLSAATAAEEIEVAEAPDDAVEAATDAGPRRHGRPRKRPAGRAARAAR